jgi:hypothetical protein
MMNTDLYEFIFKRKSIRKFGLNPMSNEALGNISENIKKLKPLNENIKTDLKILPLRDVKSILPWKSPYYIAAFSEVKDGYLTNIGFMLQQMDLFLSANCIGSCWQGWPKPTKGILTDSKLEFVIMMAFGKSNEKLHRENVSDFKRKPLDQIRNIIWADELLEPVRLAPTTSQPWFFTGSKGIIHVHCVQPRSVMPKQINKFKQIEIGIGICHLWLAIKHFGKSFEILNDISLYEDIPKGYQHVFSVRVD